MSESPKLAVLAFGAHPDDIELGCGGLLARCARRGQAVGAVDLTRGEGASRGTVEERAREAAQAAEILGLSVRENLALPDLHLEDSTANRYLVADLVRRYRADLVLAPLPQDRHPDHAAASAFVTHGAFYARLPKIVTDHPPHSPAAVLYYLIHENVTPSFVVDISEVWEQKQAAVKAYRSQFEGAMPAGYKFVGTSDYHVATGARAMYWGAQIQCAYGEAYVAPRTLRVDDPVALLVGS
ncbi:MAG: bacillithiol biosynthesis deacetylase BshB1 [Armatimonadetes bacterium]|nr:bacillithiol biosynthesis deacetylase BshB1 [Armatimonadota bacterium]